MQPRLQCALGAILSATIACAGRGPDTPVSPSVGTRSGPVLSGVWTGLLERCIANSCPPTPGWEKGRPLAFSLRISPDRRAVIQFAVEYDAGQARAPFAVDLLESSPRAVGAAVVLRGATTFPGSAAVLSVFRGPDVNVEVELDPTRSDLLGGIVRYTSSGGQPGTPTGAPETQANRIISATRIDPASEGMRGQWSGYGERVRCEGNCASYGEDPVQASPFLLEIQEAGTSAVGWLFAYGTPRIQLTGGASAAHIGLAGLYQLPGCRAQYDGIVCMVSIDGVEASIDDLQRMRGRVHYRTSGFNGNYQRFDVTGTMELVNVARWPQ